MKITQHFNPVRLVMGAGAVNTLGKEVKQFGNKCLLVAQDNNEAMIAIRDKIGNILSEAEIAYDTFSDIRPNPLVSDIMKGVEKIRKGNYEAIVAVGGGSVIDTAKILRVSSENDIDWKEAFATRIIAPVKEKLPMIAIPTTAGTGSHCTQAAIVSDNNNVKHSVYSYDFFSTVALVDYTLTMSLPKSLTASTGFDAFCHLSESYIMGMLSPIMKMFNVEAMKTVADVLPKLMSDNKEEYRQAMSVADSCAGISLSNGGAIIPHAFGEVLSSTAYRINHGCSLALCYPSFVEHYFDNEEYGQRVKDVIDIINKDRVEVHSGKDARVVMEKFIESLGMSYELSAYEITTEELAVIREAMQSQKRFKPEDVQKIINDICDSAKLG